jgi:DNA-binding protein HU-beta
MNKAELIEAIASQVGLSKTKVGEVIDALTETVTKTICDGEPVRITGFGTFEPRPRRAKSAINPRTGERIPMGRGSCRRSVLAVSSRKLSGRS